MMWGAPGSRRVVSGAHLILTLDAPAGAPWIPRDLRRRDRAAADMPGGVRGRLGALPKWPGELPGRSPVCPAAWAPDATPRALSGRPAPPGGGTRVRPGEEALVTPHGTHILSKRTVFAGAARNQSMRISM